MTSSSPSPPAHRRPARLPLPRRRRGAARDPGDAPPACPDGGCRGRDVTAWIEVQSAEGDWVPVDVTPQHTDRSTARPAGSATPRTSPRCGRRRRGGRRPRAGAARHRDRTTRRRSRRGSRLRSVGDARVVGIVPRSSLARRRALPRRRRCQGDAPPRSARGRRPARAVVGGWDEYVDSAVDPGLPRPPPRPGPSSPRGTPPPRVSRSPTRPTARCSRRGPDGRRGGAVLGARRRGAPPIPPRGLDVAPAGRSRIVEVVRALRPPSPVRGRVPSAVRSERRTRRRPVRRAHTMNDPVAWTLRPSRSPAIVLYVWIGASLSAVFRKAGEEPWQAWVPILNAVVLLRLGGHVALAPAARPRAGPRHAGAAGRLHRRLPPGEPPFGCGSGMTVLAVAALPGLDERPRLGPGALARRSRSPPGRSRCAAATRTPSACDARPGRSPRTPGVQPGALRRRRPSPAAPAGLGGSNCRPAPPAPSVVRAPRLGRSRRSAAAPRPGAAADAPSRRPPPRASAVRTRRRRRGAPTARAADAGSTSPPTRRRRRAAALLDDLDDDGTGGARRFGPPRRLLRAARSERCAPGRPRTQRGARGRRRRAPPVARVPRRADAPGRRGRRARRGPLRHVRRGLGGAGRAEPGRAAASARGSVSAQHGVPEIPDGGGLRRDDHRRAAPRRRGCSPRRSARPIAVTSDALIIGRRPSADPDFPDAQLVPISDETRTMSKTHARLELLGDECGDLTSIPRTA